MKKQPVLMKNMILNALYKCTYILFPMITIPYLSRTIFADGIGKVNFSISIVNYFLIFASLGIPQYGIREIAKRRGNSYDISKVFTEIFIINLISTLVCIILYYCMISFIPYFSEQKSLFRIMGIMLILNIFKVDWFFQGMEEYGYIARRSIIVKVASLIFIILFVKKPEDYVIYGIIYVAALSGNDILNMIKIREYIIPVFKNLNISKHFKSILILVSTQLAINIYINLDTTMIGIFSGNTAVGIYTNASKLSKLIVTTITSVCVVLLPRMSFYLKDNKTEKINEIVSKILELILFISVPMTIGIFLLSEDIVLVLFGASFSAATITIKILTFLVVILSIGNLFGSQVLMTFEQENKLLISVVFGALINFSLNMILIPKFAENGAAIASVIAEIVVLIIQIRAAIEYVNVNIPIKRLYGIILGNIVIIFVCIITKSIFQIGLMRLLISIFFSVIVYLIINIMFKESFFRETILKFRNLKNS